MGFDDMYSAVKDAERQLSLADNFAQKMAMMLVGRLRKCQPYVLARLKAELKDFNAHTGNWKS